MAEITAGRSTVFKRCSSVLRRFAPSTVIGTFGVMSACPKGWHLQEMESVQPLVQRLDRVRDELAHAGDAERGGTRSGERGVSGDLVGQRLAADLVAVLDRRALLLHRVDDERDL